MLKQFFFLLPFLFFGMGYFFTRSFFYSDPFPIPSIIGKELLEGLSELSLAQLNARLIDQKEDAELPAGTILNQIPSPGQAARIRQTIYLVTTKKPNCPMAPSLVGKTIFRIEQELQSTAIKIRQFPIISNYPKGTCIAQIPAAGEPFESHKLILYIAQPSSQPYLIPNFSGRYLSDVQDLLSLHSFKIDIIYPNRRIKAADPIVISQRPLAGSFIDLKPLLKPSIQLTVQ